MSVSEVQSVLAEFDEYTKITVVRNPYDRAISYFHYSHPTFTPPGGIPLDYAINLIRRDHKNLT